jgi:hypothetical protein
LCSATASCLTFVCSTYQSAINVFLMHITVVIALIVLNEVGSKTLLGAETHLQLIGNWLIARCKRRSNSVVS